MVNRDSSTSTRSPATTTTTAGHGEGTSFKAGTNHVSRPASSSIKEESQDLQKENEDKGPGYDDTYDEDIRLSVPEKEASFRDNIPHGPWKRTFEEGEFPNNLTLSSNISPDANSFVYSDVNLNELPVAPWCGTTLVGHPS
ncbi:hypothetical protein BGZ83_004212, partial [Gryganskiella cystojenkinii]